MGHYERSIFTTFGGVLVIFDYNANSLVQSVLRGEDMRVFQYAAFGGRWYSDVWRRSLNVM